MNQPYGGKLVTPPTFNFQDFKKSPDYTQTAHLKLSDRQSCDLEMLQMGAFSPLAGFMTEAQYKGILENQRLPTGTFFPLPITLDITAETAEKLKGKEFIALESKSQTEPIAILRVESIYKLNKEAEMDKIFLSRDAKHPSVKHLKQAGDYAVGGTLVYANKTAHYDFPELRLTPTEARSFFEKNGWTRIVAFQTRNPMHRAHFELTLRAAEKADARVFLNPVVGMTKEDDIDPFTRVRCYKEIVKKYPEGRGALGLIPLAMRMAGPNEVLMHMIIRKNFGATHFIVGRDHAGPGKDSTGKSFYGPFDAQNNADAHCKEIGIEVLKFEEMQYSKTRKKYVETKEILPTDEILKISGTEFRAKLLMGEEIPEWFSFPEVARELNYSTVPTDRKGLCIFFTGLSASGKTTLAKALQEKLLAKTHRSISILDGDELREHICKNLGFSQEDREENIRRIAFLGNLVVKHRGIAICSPIAPYEVSRVHARQLISQSGNFILVHVSTPLEECEKRDPKGLYKKAREGIVKHFTGIDDPFEAPLTADLSIDTSKHSVDDCLNTILSFCHEKGYLKT